MFLVANMNVICSKRDKLKYNAIIKIIIIIQ